MNCKQPGTNWAPSISRTHKNRTLDGYYLPFSGATQSKRLGHLAWHEGLRSLPALTAAGRAQPQLSGGFLQ